MAERPVQQDAPGVAKIKPEFLLLDYKPTLDTEYVSEEVKQQLEGAANDIDENEPSGPPNKKIKLKGRNKQRPKGKKIEASDKLCPAIMQERECSFGDKCKFNHDKAKFIASKREDIGSECYLFKTYGKCPYGIACRFAKSHMTEDFKNVVNAEVAEKNSRESHITNVLKKDLQVSLWKRRYDFSKSDKVLEKVCPWSKDQKRRDFNKNTNIAPNKGDNVETENKAEVGSVAAESSERKESSSILAQSNNGASDGSAVGNGQQHVVAERLSANVDAASGIECENTSVADLNVPEAKKIDFSDKLYLAPLTTVGNLPFRRICKRFGVDVTCGEMAVCTNLLQGQQSEWALLKRHESEDIFGVQLCGGYPDSMTRCSQLICETMDVDFIDINCGCPIDLIFNKGEGSALMGRTGKFEQIVNSMRSVMDVPLTVKLRTGIYDNRNIAHTLMPRLREWGVSLTTLHGRSRQQRYTKLADWDYIQECAKAAAPMPLFGNGDIMSYEDANLRRQQTGVAGLMIARGALIKPWVFTEIKEQRHWDISSTERYDMLKDYVNFGLDHWGSDSQGVENTRRFLLEWLSFLYRYIPVGLLDRVPQQINERPPYYKGRNDLETLMASPNCGDWLKISEMLLGPVPIGFNFLPKHKANAYK
ncbi:DUS3L-like protein [Mya arenaria]|uniref:tRNA-dihydrouridine(47) synthase [NAD(P)(+)] n=1 Tax=Mya arenaria TaxID=6604 RepID=A0ABY7DEC5_MYAAR|nr:tRNA-dihydrouridine(47) synthase [NAD(P)(+)]-like [Mya arenaria]XP_052802333.1 tRNA-dihydrouridine(47) synthase [NAD(P)(+)]-like [Mya arenaria]WAQ95070.1 DUS3L-like protein [Mya arenaria]